jgi:hypothetical protein
MCAKLKNRDIFQAAGVPNTLKTEKMKGLPFAGKQLKMAQKLVKVAPLEVQLFSNKEYQVMLTSRDTGCSVTRDMNESSNDDAVLKKLSSQSVQPPSVSDVTVSAVSIEAPFRDTAVPKSSHLNPFSHCVQSSPHMKLPYVALRTENKDSIMNVRSIVPEGSHMKEGTTVTELELPAHTPNNNSGILIASRIGDSTSASTLPIVPEQISDPASAAGTLPVAKLYQAVRIGSVMHLIPVCNNSMSHVKQ